MKGYSFQELVKLAEAAVKRAGDTMTGDLTAPKVLVSGAQGTEVNALTRKDYVDSAIAAGDALQVSKTGDTMTGPLIAKSEAEGVVIQDDVGRLRGKKLDGTASWYVGKGSASALDLYSDELGAGLKITGGADGIFYNNKKLYHEGNKPTLGSDLGLQWQLPWAGGESLYIRLATLGLTDNDITFVLAGFGDYGTTKRATYNVTAATRAAGISVDVNALDVDMISGAKPIIYHRRVGESFEVWLKTPSYQLSATFTRISGNGGVVNLDSSTTTEPTGLTAVTINQIYTTRFKPTAGDVGAVNKTGDTMTGNLNTPRVLVSGVQGVEGNALTRKDYVDGQVATKAPMAHTHTVANITDLKPQAANAAANTLALRDSEADIHARLLRATYPDQSDMSGALAFRTNNSDNNYTRYCSNPAAVREWMRSAKTSWDINWRAFIEHTESPMTEYHIPGRAAVASYLSNDGNYRISTSNGYGYAYAERLRLDASGNLFVTSAIYEAGQRVYSPNNQPHYSHNHNAAQGNADIVASGYGQIGTYGFFYNASNTRYNTGDIVAGSGLRWSGARNNTTGSAPAGTWKCLGIGAKAGSSEGEACTLYLRIA